MHNLQARPATDGLSRLVHLLGAIRISELALEVAEPENLEAIASHIRNDSSFEDSRRSQRRHGGLARLDRVQDKAEGVHAAATDVVAIAMAVAGPAQALVEDAFDNRQFLKIASTPVAPDAVLDDHLGMKLEGDLGVAGPPRSVRLAGDGPLGALATTSAHAATTALRAEPTV